MIDRQQSATVTAAEESSTPSPCLDLDAAGAPRAPRSRSRCWRSWRPPAAPPTPSSTEPSWRRPSPVQSPPCVPPTGSSGCRHVRLPDRGRQPGGRQGPVHLGHLRRLPGRVAGGRHRGRGHRPLPPPSRRHRAGGRPRLRRAPFSSRGHGCCRAPGDGQPGRARVLRPAVDRSWRAGCSPTRRCTTDLPQALQDEGGWPTRACVLVRGLRRAGR
jgi:hypothetical protein